MKQVSERFLKGEDFFRADGTRFTLFVKTPNDVPAAAPFAVVELTLGSIYDKGGGDPWVPVGAVSGSGVIVAEPGCRCGFRVRMIEDGPAGLYMEAR